MTALTFKLDELLGANEAPKSEPIKDAAWIEDCRRLDAFGEAAEDKLRKQEQKAIQSNRRLMLR